MFVVFELFVMGTSAWTDTDRHRPARNCQDSRGNSWPLGQRLGEEGDSVTSAKKEDLARLVSEVITDEQGAHRDHR